MAVSQRNVRGEVLRPHGPFHRKCLPVQQTVQAEPITVRQFRDVEKILNRHVRGLKAISDFLLGRPLSLVVVSKLKRIMRQAGFELVYTAIDCGRRIRFTMQDVGDTRSSRFGGPVSRLHQVAKGRSEKLERRARKAAQK